MNFAFSEEQEELRNIVRQFLEAKSSEADVREQMDTERGYDPVVWAQMAEQLGLQASPFPKSSVARVMATSNSSLFLKRWAAPFCARRTSPQ